MPYFPVDDQVAFHPKIMAAGNAAVGLWTRAGSWCKAHTTGGKVPSEIAHVLGRNSEISRLVSVGLWTVIPDGFQFHDWDHQAGNFDADEEKARREAEREKNRIRKRAQRERDRSQGHAESHGVTPGGVTGPPSPSPVPSPLSTDRHTGPVPYETGLSTGTDEGESVEQLCAKQAGLMGVDFTKVKTAIGKACGRFPEPTSVMQIIATVLERANQPVRSPTGLVLAAIREDWAEWQKFLDEQVAS